eukprot:TRINITY_DN73592_c0_g1_i1.p1 TRINITY_DN73592_c0_g1~~TRINITY_DN73592_c0_g1_i1.p1  ORF type:complete len:352 (+),score=27.93 TRINITY_DN73592_c0_g1_i1:62-1057(+)
MTSGLSIGMNVLRTSPAILFLLYNGGFVALDDATNTMWSAVLGQEFFKHPMSEAYVAAFSFDAWIILWSIADALPGLAHIRMGKFDCDTKPLHIAVAVNSMLSATFLAWGEPFGRAIPFYLFLAGALWCYFSGTVGVIRAHKGMCAYMIRMYFSFLGYLIGVFAFITVKGGHAKSDTGPISFGRLTMELVVGVVAYDFIFGCLHYGMHRITPLAASGHRQHHEISQFAGRILASDTVNHAPVDFALQVMTNIFVQNICLFGLPKHKMSRYLHNILVTGLLVESHAGYDTPFSTHQLWPGLLGGAKRHLEHHNQGKHFYQQFFCYLDDWVFQ